MPTLLSLYRDHMAAGDRELTVADLVSDGVSESNAHVILHRLRKQGAAVSAGPGKVRLLAPGESPHGDTAPRHPSWKQLLLNRFKAKATGFSVLPKRYKTSWPEEFLLPPGQVEAAARLLRERHPDLDVVTNRFHRGEQTVCLYGSRVRGNQASRDEALVHTYRNAPRHEFALALQAVLMHDTQLDWSYLRRQPEWPELAGIFVAVNEQAGRKVFPQFRSAEPPDLSYVEIGTVAQPFVARGDSRGA